MTKKTTNAKSTNKSNASAQNQIEKKAQTSKVKTENKNEMNYPDWTIPEHLNDKDHKDLKRVFELYKEGKYEIALNYAYGLDTIVRDEIPSEVWKEIGGLLTPKGEEALIIDKNKQETVDDGEKEKNVIKDEKQEVSTNVTIEPSIEEKPVICEENKPREAESNDEDNKKINEDFEPKQEIVLKLTCHLKNGFLLKEGSLFSSSNITIDGNS